MALGERRLSGRTLFLLVFCSLDRSRALLAERVVHNLIEQNARFEFFSHLLVFDNASRFDGHLKLLPPDVRVFRSNWNIGYWSAIQWAVRNYKDVFPEVFDFIYIIESDLIHKNMGRLAACEQFLLDNASVGAVRTQEFSVRWRRLYDKRWAYLPFARRHSWVVQYNPVTKEPVWLKLADRTNRIYFTNFHSKLPALNRLPAMCHVFDALCAQESISEMDFIELYHGLYPINALLDGGIYRDLGSIPSPDIVSGSYSTPDRLREIGYRGSRLDLIVTTGFEVEPLAQRA